jgi:hypothetical protein
MTSVRHSCLIILTLLLSSCSRLSTTTFLKVLVSTKSPTSTSPTTPITAGTTTPSGILNSVDLAVPNFGANVLTFDVKSMTMANIQAQINTVFNSQQLNQFGAQRSAFLLKPGSYALNIPMGFYTTLNGLGTLPDDVTITGSVNSTAALLPGLSGGNATCNFWRGAENFAVVPTQNSATDIWAVAQATWLRRVHVKGSIHLWDSTVVQGSAWASGGFIADSKIDNTIAGGTQQQFLTRNDSLNNWQGSNINMVFVGDQGAPSGTWPSQRYSVIANTPTIREKPYLNIDNNGVYGVVVPPLKSGSSGTSWSNGVATGSLMHMSQFHIALPGDTAQTLNAQLALGKSLILTPGIYPLSTSLNVNNPNTVILGLGYATLQPTQGTPAMVVADVDGVSIAGIIFDAGPTNSPTQLQLGSATNTVSHAANPTALFDLTCRVGGAGAASTSSCFTVYSNNVLIDNIWLWRADHGDGAGWSTNPSAQGIIVNGAYVTAYGLFVEHFQNYQTMWNGDNGSTYFYQSELPYDVPSQNVWNSIALTGNPENGYASYRVAAGVKQHTAEGLGVYSVFYNNQISAENAIEAPSVAGISFQHMATSNFNNSGAITHIFNQVGAAATSPNSVATSF